MPKGKIFKKPSKPSYFNRLEFVRLFMKAYDITMVKAGEILECSGPAVYSMLKVDDMPISYIERLAGYKDYRFTVMLQRPGDDGVAGDLKLGVDEIMRFNKGGGVTLKRLSFLEVALKRYGITRTELSQRSGIAQSSMRATFARDDIYMSRLFQIADSLGLSLVFDISPATAEETAGCRCVESTVTLRSCVRLRDEDADKE